MALAVTCHGHLLDADAGAAAGGQAFAYASASMSDDGAVPSYHLPLRRACPDNNPRPEPLQDSKPPLYPNPTQRRTKEPNRPQTPRQKQLHGRLEQRLHPAALSSRLTLLVD